MPQEQVVVTNSRGVIWRSEDGKEGSGKNDEQRALAQVGRPSYPQDLVSIVQHVKPDILIGAVGVVPNCFSREVVEAMLAVQDAKPEEERLRPIVFALSNPKTQAEITAKDCYTFSKGRAIFGSGTRFDAEMVAGSSREPGQVNNFFIFPGMSFGAMQCEASTIPERFFMSPPRLWRTASTNVTWRWRASCRILPASARWHWPSPPPWCWRRSPWA